MRTFYNPPNEVSEDFLCFKDYRKLKRENHKHLQKLSHILLTVLFLPQSLSSNHYHHPHNRDAIVNRADTTSHLGKEMLKRNNLVQSFHLAQCDYQQSAHPIFTLIPQPSFQRLLHLCAEKSQFLQSHYLTLKSNQNHEN